MLACAQRFAFAGPGHSVAAVVGHSRGAAAVPSCIRRFAAGPVAASGKTPPEEDLAAKSDRDRGRFLSGYIARLLKASGTVPDADLRRLISKGAAWSAYGGIGFIGLGTLGVDTSPLVASLSVAGITVGFAARDLASNYISGLLMALAKPFNRGDHITVGKAGDGVTGIIEAIDMRYTFLRPVGKVAGARVLMVPNSKIMSSVIQVDGYHWELASATDASQRASGESAAAAPTSTPQGALKPLVDRATADLPTGLELELRWRLRRQLMNLSTSQQKVVVWAAAAPRERLSSPEWQAYVAESGEAPSWMPADLELLASP